MNLIGNAKCCCYLLVVFALLVVFVQWKNASDWGQDGQFGTDPGDYDWNWGQPPPGNESGNASSAQTPRTVTSELSFDRYLDFTTRTQTPPGTFEAWSPPTLRGTFLGVRALQQLGFGWEIDSTAVQKFLLSCFNGSSHLFTDESTNAIDNGTRVSGYSAIEGTYYAIATMVLLGTFNPGDWQDIARTVVPRQDSSGGFACRLGVCTTHDAFFAYKTLQLLGSASSADVDALASFLDGRQMADPTRWWEYGAFTNLPAAIGQDTDFTDPNLVSSYYAIATLSACGRLGALNEAGFVQFAGLLKNSTSKLYSYSAGNERAEHVGTAFLLATDPFLAGDGAINYSAAGTALLARLEQGYYTEGRRAPANHTLSAACEAVWGLAEGGRLPALSAAAKEGLYAYITSHYVSSGSMGGFSLTRLASFQELASIVPAVVGAGKLDQMDVNALYSFVKCSYVPLLAYFSPDGDAVLQRDLPGCYNPASPDGFLARGIVVTLPALQVLKAVGRLNDFLGETHVLGSILGNITACQFLNTSAPTVHGAFCGHAAFASECQENENWRGFIGPQWTTESLEAISILDPVNPTSHFNATAAWQYLSQFYVEDSTTAYFAPPEWVNVSRAEWTCRVSMALCHAEMDGFFNMAKVNAWVIANLNGSSLREVAAHLKFVAASGAGRAGYAVCTLNALQNALLHEDARWYKAQGGVWPDVLTVGALATLRNDRTLVLASSVPAAASLGSTIQIATRVETVFFSTIPDARVICRVGLSSTTLLNYNTLTGLFEGNLAVPQNESIVGSISLTLQAEKIGWVPAETCSTLLISRPSTPDPILPHPPVIVPPLAENLLPSTCLVLMSGVMGSVLVVKGRKAVSKKLPRL